MRKLGKHQCPECGSPGPFGLQAVAFLSINEEGYDPEIYQTDIDWDSKSPMWCVACKHEATKHDFTVEEAA